MVCEDCGKETNLMCEQCGRVFCMVTFRRYSWQATSRLCWQCQNEADKEAFEQIVSGKRGKDVVWRKWPREGKP